jgi:hypothetical protein
MFNLGYGMIGMLYAYYYKMVSQRYSDQEIAQHLDFLASLSSFFYYFTALFIGLSVFFYFSNKKRPVFNQS